jgi:SAM-dependent methyltransferase
MAPEPIGEMLSFYREQGVAPVHQDISDLAAHFRRRQTLYHHLGLLPQAFAGRRVAEVGPGTGHNALFVAACEPAEYVLVEPNPAGREAIAETFAPWAQWRARMSVSPRTAEEFLERDPFDILLCEGLVGASGSGDPAHLVRSLSRNVAAGGVLVLTCTDYTAYVSESLRRFLAVELAPDGTVGQRSDVLARAFAPHLRSLPGFSRVVEDWVVDTLINPASIARLFSFPEVVDCLAGEFDLYATSPRIVADWTWYKGATLEPDYFNGSAVEAYWRGLHNFLDYRHLLPAREPEENRLLLASCKQVHDAIGTYDQGRSDAQRSAVLNEVSNLYGLCSSLPGVRAALEEFLSWSHGEVTVERVAESPAFGPWFGRGQTYLSLVRRKPVLP